MARVPWWSHSDPLVGPGHGVSSPCTAHGLGVDSAATAVCAGDQ